MISRNDPELIKIKDRIIFNLKKIIPFLEDHVTAVHPVESKYFSHLNRDDDIVNTINKKPQFIFKRVGTPFLGITAIPNRTQEKNLFFTGREVLPDIGFEGEMLSCYKVLGELDREIKKDIAKPHRIVSQSNV